MAAPARRPLLIAAGFAALVAPAAAQAPPPAPLPEALPQDVLVSRSDRTDTVAAVDLPLVLVKDQRAERVMVRRAVFVTASVERRRPLVAGAADGSEEGDTVSIAETCRWTHKSFLQREICFTSMTGLFSCTTAEVTPLPDMAEGQAELADDAAAATCTESFPAAGVARRELIDSLKARSTALFDADQAAKVDPLLRAGGVQIRREGQGPAAPAAAPARRAR